MQCQVPVKGCLGKVSPARKMACCRESTGIRRQDWSKVSQGEVNREQVPYGAHSEPMSLYSQSAANKAPTILTDLAVTTNVPGMNRNFPVLFRRQLSAAACHEQNGTALHTSTRLDRRLRTISLTRARKQAASHRRFRWRERRGRAMLQSPSWRRTRHVD